MGFSYYNNLYMRHDDEDPMKVEQWCMNMSQYFKVSASLWYQDWKFYIKRILFIYQLTNENLFTKIRINSKKNHKYCRLSKKTKRFGKLPKKTYNNYPWFLQRSTIRQAPSVILDFDQILLEKYAFLFLSKNASISFKESVQFLSSSSDLNSISPP